MSSSSSSDASGSSDAEEEQQAVQQVVTGANADPQVLQYFWDLASLQQVSSDHLLLRHLCVVRWAVLFFCQVVCMPDNQPSHPQSAPLPLLPHRRSARLPPRPWWLPWWTARSSMTAHTGPRVLSRPATSIRKRATGSSAWSSACRAAHPSW